MQQWHSKWLPLISITKLVFFPDHFWHIQEQKARYLLGRQMFLNPTPEYPESLDIYSEINILVKLITAIVWEPNNILSPLKHVN